MKVGLCTIAFRDRGIEQAIDAAAQCGCDGIEVWGQTGHLPPSATPAGAKRVRDLARERGLEILAYGSYLRLLTDEFDAQVHPVLTTARVLGTRVLRIWTGGPPSAEATDAMIDEAAEQLEGLCERAAEHGITVAFEKHDGELSDSADMILRLIRRAGIENLKTYYQPSWQPGGDDFYESLTKLLPYVVNVHAQNYLGGDLRHRTALSEGDVDYARVVGMLKESGYAGPIEVEFVEGPDPIAWARGDVAYLRSLV